MDYFNKSGNNKPRLIYIGSESSDCPCCNISNVPISREHISNIYSYYGDIYNVPAFHTSNFNFEYIKNELKLCKICSHQTNFRIRTYNGYNFRGRKRDKMYYRCKLHTACMREQFDPTIDKNDELHIGPIHIEHIYQPILLNYLKHSQNNYDLSKIMKIDVIGSSRSINYRKFTNCDLEQFMDVYSDNRLNHEAYNCSCNIHTKYKRKCDFCEYFAKTLSQIGDGHRIFTNSGKTYFTNMWINPKYLTYDDRCVFDLFFFRNVGIYVPRDIMQIIWKIIDGLEIL